MCTILCSIRTGLFPFPGVTIDENEDVLNDDSSFGNLFGTSNREQQDDEDDAWARALVAAKGEDEPKKKW